MYVSGHDIVQFSLHTDFICNLLQFSLHANMYTQHNLYSTIIIIHFLTYILCNI